MDEIIHPFFIDPIEQIINCDRDHQNRQNIRRFTLNDRHK
jgi:hypothetical protein